MLSKYASKWRWYDWIVVLVIAVLICAAIIKVAPTSGIANAIHIVLRGTAAVLQLFAEILTAIANALNGI